MKSGLSRQSAGFNRSPQKAWRVCGQKFLKCFQKFTVHEGVENETDGEVEPHEYIGCHLIDMYMIFVAILTHYGFQDGVVSEGGRQNENNEEKNDGG